MRGLTHPRFFYVDIIRRSTRASSSVRQRKVVSNKLFLFNRRLDGELLEMRENENLMRKILMRYEREGTREKGRVLILFKHSNVLTFKHFLN